MRFTSSSLVAPITGIVFNQGKLLPTHGFVKPIVRGEGSRVSESAADGERGNGESRVPTLLQYDKFIIHEFRNREHGVFFAHLGGNRARIPDRSCGLEASRHFDSDIAHLQRSIISRLRVAG